MKASNEALRLQAKEYERRLDQLNHEQSRMSTFVPRELLDRYMEEIAEWKRRQEHISANSLPRSEFATYRDTTERALTMAAGNKMGVATAIGAVVTGIVVVGIVAGIIFKLVGH